jgi:hypothetical protein
MVEARLHREQGSALNEQQKEHHEIAALGASLLAAHVEREEIVEELSRNVESLILLPTSDFGPGSDFDPDWGGTSESGDDQTQEVGEEKVDRCKPTSEGSEKDHTNRCKPGLPLSRMPVAWGGALPGIAMSSKAIAKGKSSSECLPSQKSGPSDQTSDADAQKNNKYIAEFRVSQGSSELVQPAVLQNSQNDQETTPASSDRSRQPWVVLNAAGRERGHYERSWPPLAYSHEDMNRMGLLCRRAEAPIARIEDVVEWLKDYGVAANLMSPILTSFEWPGEITIREASKLHSFGKWYRFELRQPQPSPIAGTNTTSSTKYSHPWADYRRCIHATSLYVLPSILHQ